MRFLLTSLLATLWILTSFECVQADIVFRTEGTSPTVQLGRTTTFDIYISSDAGPIDVNYLEVRANAGDASGAAGHFTPASQVFLLLGGVDDAFDLSDPVLPGSAYSINQGPNANVDAEVVYARLILDTSGAQLGDYEFNLDSTFAFLFAGAAATEYPTRIANRVAYSITAVPEANSFALLALFSLGSPFTWRRRR